MSANVTSRVFKGGGRAPVVKAETPVPATASTAATDAGSSSDGGIGVYKIVRPLLNPKHLLQEHIDSSALRPNIDAYSSNIHGNGFALDPAFDFNADDIDERVDDAMAIDKGGQWGADEPIAAPEVIAAKIAELKLATRRQAARAQLFFKNACSTKSWTDLIMGLRQDLEIIGYAFLEVRRDVQNRISGFAPVRPQDFVALKSTQLIEVEIPYARSPLSWDLRTEDRYGHLWGQCDSSDMVKTVFKPFGDPRVISSKTTVTYASLAELQAAEPGVRAATELVQFCIPHAATSFFGLPRWIGATMAVQGSRKAELINASYFDNKSVPPLAILVSGGSITPEAVTRIESFVEDELVGVENFHKILVIEAEPASDPMSPLNSGKVRIELVPLTAAQHDDGLFMKYIAKCRDMVGESFRNPRIVRGDIDGINRATALAALAFAESHVYGPLREGFDWWVNTAIMSALGLSLVRYRTQSPVATDLDTAMAVAELTKANVLVPGEGRGFAARVFNTPLVTITEPWTKKPMPLTLAEALTAGTGDVERRSEGVVGTAQSQKQIGELLGEPEVVTLRLPGPLSRYFIPDPAQQDES